MDRVLEATEEAKSAYAWLKDLGTLPDLTDTPTYDMNTGFTYPFGLYVPSLKGTYGVHCQWVIHAAQEKGWAASPTSQEER